MEPITSKEYEKFLVLISNPPPGSRIAEATRSGIDLTHNLEKLALTPIERIRTMEAAAFTVKGRIAHLTRRAAGRFFWVQGGRFRRAIWKRYVAWKVAACLDRNDAAAT